MVWGLYNDSILDKLVVFGYFSQADGKPINGIGTWDGQNFDTLGTGGKSCLGGKYEMIIRYKNKLYVQFYDYYLSCYDYATKQWSQIPGLFNQRILDATIFNDELILVGDFTKVGNTTVKNIIKFNGTSYDTLPRPSFVNYINAVEVYKNELYIGGNFQPLPFNAIAKFNGTSWVNIGNNTELSGGTFVNCLKVYNGKLYVGGTWAFINGVFHPSCAAWDGEKFHNIGTLIFQGGQPAAISQFKIYKNKLYAFYGLDYIISATNPSDTIKTKNMAVWNDTIWCGVVPKINFGLIEMENYKDQWYFTGGQTMYGDTLVYTPSSKVDTVNYLGIYIGNGSKLERNCFDKKPLPEIAQGIFPNPTQDEINFNVSSIFGETCNLKIINNLGQIISEHKNINTISKLNIDVFSDGVYLFMFYYNGIQKTFKVIKQ